MFTILLNAMPVGYQEPQEAFLWFIPLLIGVLIIVVATRPVKGNSLAILGMPEAGKTQFLRNLQGKTYSRYESTNGAVDYGDFEYVYGERRIKVTAGKDIGGSDENIKPYWKKMIEQNDIVVFIFDISRYRKDEKYKRLTNSRLDYIERHIGNKDWAIIASHLDKVNVSKGKEKELATEMQRCVKGKEYAKLFDLNFFICDLTDCGQFNTIVEKLFVEN